MTKERIFRRRFSDLLLETYGACIQIKNNSGLIAGIRKYFENKAKTTVIGLIAEAGGAAAKVISKAAGEEDIGQAGGNFIENLIKGSGILYLLWKKKKEEDARRDADNFLHFVDVDSGQEMRDVSRRLADHLCFHFKNGIDRLYYSTDDQRAVVKLALFFATAIIKEGMRKGGVDGLSDDERFEELLKAAIPEAEDKLYCESFFGLRTRKRRLKTNDEKIDKNWTIQGLLLRAPARVQGESIKLVNNSRSPKKDDSTDDDDNNNKYPAIIFRSSAEAENWGFIIENEEEYAPLRVVKEPAGKFSVRNTVLYFFKSDCNFREWQEDQLRLVVKRRGDENLDYIKSFLQKNENPIFNININGRGRANSLCSIANGLWDKTPLMIAAQEGQEETVKFLVEKGANFNMHGSMGYSALDYAIRAGLATSDYARKGKQVAIAEYLKGEGAFQFKTDSNHLKNLKESFEKMECVEKSASSEESRSNSRLALSLSSPSPCPIDRFLSLGRSRSPSPDI